MPAFFRELHRGDAFIIQNADSLIQHEQCDPQSGGTSLGQLGSDPAVGAAIESLTTRGSAHFAAANSGCSVINAPPSRERSGAQQSDKSGQDGWAARRMRILESELSGNRFERSNLVLFARILGA